MSDLRCPRAAEELKPYLGIMEFYFNSIRDEKFMQSIWTNNCAQLGGNSGKICQLILSRQTLLVRYDEFSNIMKNCQSERLEWNGGQNDSLFDRSNTFTLQSWPKKLVM